MRLATVLFVLGSFVAACGSSRSGVTIEGAVQSSGAAAAGVAISAQGHSGTTNAAGQFALVNLAAGNTRLQLVGDGVNDAVAVGTIPGMRVTMTMTLANSRIEVDEIEKEFSGAITAIAAPNITVAGITVVTTSTTVFRKGDTAITFADLTVGETVDIDGTANADGSVTAHEIDVETPEVEEAEVEGVIQTIDATHATFVVTVSGDDEDEAPTSMMVTIDTADSTVIKSGDETIAFSALMAGDRVHVRGTRQSDGSVLASVIKVAPGFHARAELEGTVSAIDTTTHTLTVAGIVVTTDANTQISIGDDHSGTLADIHVGDIVHVEGTPPGDGTILASSIRVEMP
jgi:hypothetical protein